MTHILFIDDEAFFARPYVRELQKDHHVSFCESVVEAIDILKSNHDIRALVLDIHLPPPVNVPAIYADDGVKAGLWFLEETRNIVITRFIPVLILTNRSLKVVSEGVEELRFPEQLIEVHHKTDTPCEKLRTRMGVMLNRWRQH